MKQQINLNMVVPDPKIYICNIYNFLFLHIYIGRVILENHLYQNMYQNMHLCKVLEDFVVSWMISDIGDKIDARQFGCLKGTSTTYCLLDMIETWLSFLDGHSRHIRICFLDFAKAFDRIGHNVAVTKLLELGVR